MEEKAKPIFTEEIRQLTTSDPGHPDTFNPVFKQVHDNTKYLKEQQESAVKDIETIQVQVDAQDEQIKNLSSPYVIPEGSDIPIQDRVKGKMYFKVTSRQSGGSSNGIIKVSPNMGIEIKE